MLCIRMAPAEHPTERRNASRSEAASPGPRGAAAEGAARGRGGASRASREVPAGAVQRYGRDALPGAATEEGQLKSCSGHISPRNKDEHDRSDRASMTAATERLRRTAAKRECRTMTPSRGSRSSRGDQRGGSIRATPGAERRAESQHQLRQRLSLVEKHLELGRVNAEPRVTPGSSSSGSSAGAGCKAAQKDSGESLRTPRPCGRQNERLSSTPHSGWPAPAQATLATRDTSSRVASQSPEAGDGDRRIGPTSVEDEVHEDSCSHQSTSLSQNSQRAASAGGRTGCARPGAKPIADGGESTPRGRLQSWALVDAVEALSSRRTTTAMAATEHSRCSQSPPPRNVVRHRSLSGERGTLLQPVQLLDEAERIARKLQEQRDRQHAELGATVPNALLVNEAPQQPTLVATHLTSPVQPHSARFMPQVREAWLSTSLGSTMGGTSDPGTRPREVSHAPILVSGSGSIGTVCSVVRRVSGALPSSSSALPTGSAAWQLAAGAPLWRGHPGSLAWPCRPGPARPGAARPG